MRDAHSFQTTVNGRNLSQRYPEYDIVMFGTVHVQMYACPISFAGSQFAVRNFESIAGSQVRRFVGSQVRISAYSQVRRFAGSPMHY